jgi:hypothetical protein
MPIAQLYFNYTGPFNTNAGGGGGESNTAPWTFDWDMPPSTVYALCSLGTYASRQSGQAGASVGILSYITQDPTTGTPSQPIVLSPPITLALTGSGYFGNIGYDIQEGLVPCFFDNNVIIITFAYNCFADNWVYAWASFSVFVWD